MGRFRLTGTEPDGREFIPAADMPEDFEARLPLIEKRLAPWKEKGMTFVRVTSEMDQDGWRADAAGRPRGLWLEVWRDQPQRQADFNPPKEAWS